MGFEQATIKVEKEKEFEELKSSIERAFRPEKVGKLLKQLQSRGIRIRDFAGVTAQGLWEKVDDTLAKSSTTAQKLYDALPVSDQAQIREFYLSKIEEVDSAMRTRFQKIYRYY